MSGSSRVKTYSWTIKGFGIIAGCIFCISVVFNRSVFKVFYFDWVLGSFLVCLMIAFILKRRTILPKDEWMVIILPLMWIGYAILLTPFTYDIAHHRNALAQTSIITLIALFAVLALFPYRKLSVYFVRTAVLAWTIINGIVLIFYLLGYYIPEGVVFSGVCKNRNDYAAQSVILLALFVYFAKPDRTVRLIVVSANFIMIAASLSVTGFLFSFFVFFYPIFARVSIIKKIFVILFALICFVGAALIFPQVQARLLRFSMVFTNMDSMSQSDSGYLRAWYLIKGIPILLAHPLGIGVDNGRQILPLPPLFAASVGYSTGIYSHNNWLEMGFNVGFPGFILFYSPLVHIFLKIKKNHPYYEFSKMFILLYIFMGVSCVQYSTFIFLLQYILIIFLYYYYRKPNEKNIVHCVYA